MNKKKYSEIFDRELMKREQSSEWSRKIVSAVFSSVESSERKKRRITMMDIVSYSFSVSAAAVLIAALWINALSERSVNKGIYSSTDTTMEDFFNPYSESNISIY